MVCCESEDLLSTFKDTKLPIHYCQHPLFSLHAESDNVRADTRTSVHIVFFYGRKALALELRTYAIREKRYMDTWLLFQNQSTQECSTGYLCFFCSKRHMATVRLTLSTVGISILVGTILSFLHMQTYAHVLVIDALLVC